MAHQYERNLIQSLSPFYIVMHFIQKYGKIRPNISDVVNIFGQGREDPVENIVHIKTQLQNIHRLQIEPNVFSPQNPETISVYFTEQNLPLLECLKQFGNSEIDFDPDRMVSIFTFKGIRTIFIEALHFELPGKWTPHTETHMQCIDAETFERYEVDIKEIFFDQVKISFRQNSNYISL